ncbi:hypothetical protein M3205_19750 [Cytobacillus firmus]|uniref:hypothetical protein n=1 Tax=Cytobacillus firmus TaxID=1399 RepID=UPI00203DADDD|nr:hypothetical protein [Cytobacillus firmus]MCM3707905.1 hypothetical protein [Cytobacillus firmus]
MEITYEQTQIAIELSSINENDTVTELQARKAYELFIGLSERPNFKIGPDAVKPRRLNDNTIEVISPEFFGTPHRIIYLTRWTIRILPFIKVLSTVGKLPAKRDSNDFEGFLEGLLNNYLHSVEEIYRNIPAPHNLIRQIDLENIRGLISKITSSVNEYYTGYPDRAYTALKEGIENHLIGNNGYLDNVLTSDEEDDPYVDTLYKMRVGSNHTYSAEEMFHIPYQLRGLVKTNRYSIPGLPCVYLGSSPLTCWEELNKPDLNTVQTSLFLVKNISFLDISTPPEAALDKLILLFRFNGVADMNEVYDELISYLVMWPLIAACSICVKNINDSFKPEYIIPQLLLQWIRQSNYDGVRYFSTKVSKYSMKTVTYYKNYALPVQEQKKIGHCNVLRSKFTLITDAVPWQMFQLYKDSYLATPNEQGVQAELEFVNDMGLLYSATDFSKLESFLINIVEKMSK